MHICSQCVIRQSQARSRLVPIYYAPIKGILSAIIFLDPGEVNGYPHAGCPLLFYIPLTKSATLNRLLHSPNASDWIDCRFVVVPPRREEAVRRRSIQSEAFGLAFTFNIAVRIWRFSGVLFLICEGSFLLFEGEITRSPRVFFSLLVKHL